MVLTGDTCGGRHTGNPSLLHFQSTALSAGRDKHLVSSLSSQLNRRKQLIKTLALSCSSVGFLHLSRKPHCTNLMVAQLKQKSSEKPLRPLTDVTHVSHLIFSQKSVHTNNNRLTK